MSRRLTRELQELQKQNLDWCSAGPADDDIFHWNAMVRGPEDTPYQGGVFNLDIAFPTEYPFKAPKVKFLTRIYHPNVKTDSGEICNDILNETWAPTLNLVDVLNIIRQMMREPSGASPLEPEIARQLDENAAAFRETAAKWTADYAT